MSAFGRFLDVGRSRGVRIGVPAGLAVVALPLAGIAGTHSGGRQQGAATEAQAVSLSAPGQNDAHPVVPSSAPSTSAVAPAQAAPAAPAAPATSTAPAAAPATTAPAAAAPAKPAAPAPAPAPVHNPAPATHIAAAPVAYTVTATAIGDVAPLANIRITEGYGIRGPWSAGHHTGVDLAAAYGTRVESIGTGTVVRSGWDGAYGIDVLIRMTDGRYVLFGHLSQASVFAGAHVTAGQQIGRSGATGHVTGPHLHFEVRTSPNYGSDVNPIAYLRAHGVDV